MKRAPKSPEFERFTSAMQHIMSVPKAEIVRQDREQKEARIKRASSDRVSRDKV